ncbi:muscarinic acetylcholine receptor M1-like [Ylistrum balloti]|uniref:muscarinic acetylcholine receptor M1-like n=1 Tax=Ylistrum balloti TaxID=509963 RepID=UPI0029059664|nr:muscarinic acetylcholine receptor M1-like [Ylistrum balloti]
MALLRPNASLLDTTTPFLCPDNSTPPCQCNDTFTNVTCTDVTSSTWAEPPYPMWLTILLGAMAAVVVLVTVLGNILVLIAFAVERSIRQPTNYFIASLAVSDLLIGTFSMPCFTLYLLLGYWPLGDIICDLWLSLDWTVCLASQYTVFFITVDRFFSVKIPAKYRNWRTEKKVIIMIAFTWIIPCAVFFTSIIGWQYFVGERTVDKYECEVQFMSDPLFTFLLTIGYYWTTLFVMIGLYTGIYRVALSLQKKAEAKHKKMTTAMSHTAHDSKKKARAVDAGAASQNSRKRTENNNARHLRGVDTTSFTKPPEEDRSSSPAFASDEDNSSSQEGACGSSKTPLTGKHADDDDDDQTCFVNSAVQTDTTYRPSLKGMLGVSFGHVSKLAFSITASSVTLPNDHGEAEEEIHTPLPDALPPAYDTVVIPPENNYQKKVNNSNSINELAVDDVINGCKYIDEESLKSLASAENIKLLSDPGTNNDSSADEGSSPIWKRRADKYMPIPIPAVTNTSNMEVIEEDRTIDTDLDHIATNALPSNGKASVTGKPHRKPLDSVRSNDTSASSERRFGSPFHALVKSMREKQLKRQKAARQREQKKSKSENRARKAFRTITFILGAYVLCWTPYHVMVFIIGLCGGYDCINIKLYQFTYWLCYLNSPVNPFCYALANQQFKRTFLRIMRFDFHRT